MTREEIIAAILGNSEAIKAAGAIQADLEVM